MPGAEDASGSGAPTAAIVAGCANVPPGPVCGVERRARLALSLARRGYLVLDTPAAAQRVLADCRVLVGEDELHLCEVGHAAVEQRLLDELGKPVDGLVSRHLNRRLSLALTRRLMSTRVRPNHVTLLTLTLGLASGVAVALGSFWFGVLGAALLQLQSVLDGVDGELARLRFQHSRLGQWLDTVSDDLAKLSFLVGMTIAADAPWLRAVGLAGLAAFVVSQGLLYRALATVYGTGDLLAFRWEVDAAAGPTARLRVLFKHDFFCFASLVLACIDRLDIALVAGAVGMIVVLATLLRQVARHGLGPPVTPAAPRRL